ncbi:MAG: glycosyltransferase family 1 protein [Gammaproteobacteria bacterium]|nr:glycosyltransferase family 1 protein [Gammaproteobacteria bacterium]
MKIVIVTDAWQPQVNGVVETLKKTRDHLIASGNEVLMLTPEGHRTIPCPSYPSIPLALFPAKKIAHALTHFKPDAIHIATEGPLGMAARRWCLRHKVKFTTSYHTQFPEYLRLRLPIPLSWSYAWFRRFHNKAVHTLVPTESQKQRLEQHGFTNVCVWGRGVDTDIFSPDSPQQLDVARPISLNMGRVAIEKNIESYLELDLPGTKVVVGDGPDLDMLKQRYPDAIFTGAKFGKELASWVAAADVFVFPSKTDTFGLVLLEAMACGVPVAAYPVTGPIDVIQHGVTGFLDKDLKTAVLNALELKPIDCINVAKQHSWEACTFIFLSLMHNNSIDTNINTPFSDPSLWRL